MALLTLLVASAVSFGRTSPGVSQAQNAPAATNPSWTVTRDFSSIWDGKDYFPVGVRTSPNTEIFNYSISKGIKDYILDVPLNPKAWNEAIDKLGDAKFIASINSIAPLATGVTVQPQWYRIPGISKARSVSVPLPGASSAFVVLAIRRDGSVVSSERVKVIDGFAKFELKALSNADHVALIYPIGESSENEDLWEGFDLHRDALLKTITNVKNKSALRGILNPLGQMPKLSGKDLTFVPTSPLFRLELAQYLEDRYRSVKTLSAGWAIGTNDLEKFDDFARLVPLWTTTRGVNRFFDPETNRLYTADPKKSTAWSDIAQVIATTRRRRVQRLVETIHKSAGVPVVQEWAGWSGTYENPDTPLDGLAARFTERTPSAVAETGSRALSSLSRWNHAGWFLASDIKTPAKDNVDGFLEDLTNVGVRAAFFRTTSKEDVDAVAGHTLTGPFSRPEALYFPENATNPAYPQRLVGQTWWVPSPFAGNRYDFGSGFFGYQIEINGQPQFVIWTDGERRRVTLLTPRPTEAKVVPNGGSNPEPLATRKGLEITLSGTPTTIANIPEMPIPDVALEAESIRYANFIAQAQKQRKDVSDEIYAGRDLKESVKKNPSRSFDLLLKLNRQLYLALSEVSWIEAESIQSHTFSEAITEAGCSGTGSLTLRTPFQTEAGVSTAKFTVDIKTQNDQEVWIAAKIPESDRDLVSLKFGSQTLKISGPPQSRYGRGYGWYKIGITRFLAARNEWRIEVQNREGVDIAFDAIVFAPAGFAPIGPSLPSLYIPGLAKPPAKKDSLD